MFSESWSSGTASQLPALLSELQFFNYCAKGQDRFGKCLSTRIWSFEGCAGQCGKLVINQRPPGMEAWTPAWQIIPITHHSCCHEPASKSGSLFFKFISAVDLLNLNWRAVTFPVRHLNIQGQLRLQCASSERAVLWTAAVVTVFIFDIAQWVVIF